MRKHGGNHSASGHQQAPARAKVGHKRARTKGKRAPTPAERAHAHEFSRMNERRAPVHAHAAAHDELPPYLGERARGLIRRLARLAMAPLSIARAVVERLRDRD